jgi:hypothetical protein
MTPLSGNAVRPPKRCYRRPRSWETFEKLFEPIMRADDTVLWESNEIPQDADAHYWWTVLDCDGRLLLAAGFHFVNRFAFVRCSRPWGGDWSEHPEYLY